MKQVVIPSIAALVLGIGIGHMIGNSVSTEPVVVEKSDPAVEKELEDLRDKLAKLERQLKKAKARRSPAPVTTEEIATPDPEQVDTEESEFSDVERGDREMIAADEATKRALELFEDQDVEGLLLLAADLLQQGEEGFLKLLELFQWLERGDQDMQAALQQMFGRHEELYVGRFLRLMADNHEEFLRFGLFLRAYQSDHGDTGSEITDEITKEMIDDFGVVLLGFYDGDDPELMGQYLDWFEQGLDERWGKDTVFAVAQIPTEDATNVLIDQIEERDESELHWIVRALAWKADPRALEPLRKLENEVSDPALRGLITNAIRRLEKL